MRSEKARRGGTVLKAIGEKGFPTGVAVSR